MTEPLIWTVLTWLVVPVTGAIGLFAFNMQRSHRLRRLLRGTPLTSIADVRAGRAVKLAGTVEYHAEPLAAPLSDRPCAFYSVVVKENAGRNSPERELFREQRGVDFCLRDESGVALVRPKSQALSDLSSDFTRAISSFLSHDERLVAFLQQRGIASEGIVLQRNLTAYEAIVVPGKQLAVAGIAQREELAVDYREAATPTPPLLLAAVGDVPLLISDEWSTFGRR